MKPINMRMKIKAISFDVDMTLWDFEKALRHSLSLVLEELRRRIPGRITDALTIDKMIEIRKSAFSELQGKAANLEIMRFEAFRKTLEFIGCSDDRLATDLNALYLNHRFEGTELYPDVIPVIDMLRADYVIGLLSNGNGYPQGCGLSDRFDFVILSDNVRVMKPNALIFDEACNQVGCNPRELMHIGDSLEMDVAGANGAGAVSVWLNRKADLNNTAIKPAYEIKRLSELTNILKKG